MRYKNTAKVYLGFVDETLQGEERLRQFTDPDKKAVKVFETSKYQNQYESIISGTMPEPRFSTPAPTRERIRKQLVRSARDQLFVAMDEGAGEAIKQYVEMSEERAYNDALSNWEKDRYNFIERTKVQWQEYAKRMKPLLDNKSEYVTKKIGQWLAIAELPFEFETSYEFSNGTVYLDFDARDIRESMIKYVPKAEVTEDIALECTENLAKYMAAGLAGVAIGADEFCIGAYEGEQILFEKTFTRTELLK